jgi:iron complex outermembrane receptor protein
MGIWLLKVNKMFGFCQRIVFFLLMFAFDGRAELPNLLIVDPDSVRTPLLLSGRVKSETNAPLPGTVATLMSKDSTYMKSTISDASGAFLLTLRGIGEYQLLISHIGYSLFRQAITVTDTTTKVSLSVILQQAAVKLKEVTVKEKPQLFEVMTDRIIVNVEGNPVLAGGSALDVLDKTPRVQVDLASKSLLIDGVPGLVLYQNGRQVQRTAEQIGTYLQTLPANTISRIEVLTQPSAKYDASGGGVILIQTKSKADEGFGGEATLAGGYGLYGKLNGSLSLNVKRSNLVMSLLYTGVYRPTYFKYTSHQSLMSSFSDTPGFSDADQFRHIDLHHQGTRLALDWQTSPNTTIGTVLQGSITDDGTSPISSISYRLPGLNKPTMALTSETRFDSHFLSASANVNWRHSIPKTKGVLSADLDYAYFKNQERSSAIFQPSRPNEGPVSLLSIQLPLAVGIGAVKVDYQGPFGGKSPWEVGLKYSNVAVQTVPQLVQSTSDFIPLISNLTRPFAYTETTGAAYVSKNQKWGNWSLQAGLRLEHTRYQGISGDSIVTRRDYTNLFPSLSISRITHRKHQLTLSYNRRIVRPNYELLSPAFIFFDPITLGRGNPQLVPQLTSVYQAGFISNKQINLSASYTESPNRIAQVLYRNDSTSATIINTTLNFDKEQRLALILSLPVSITTFWQLQTTITASRSRFYSTFQGVATTVNQSTGLFQITNTWKFNGWTADALLTYRTTAVVGFLRYHPYYTVNLGIQHSVFSKNGLFKLTATDLFKSLFSSNYGQYLNTDIAFRHTWESRQLLATLSYRFGNGAVKGIKKRGVGSEVEQDRIRRDY